MVELALCALEKPNLTRFKPKLRCLVVHRCLFYVFQVFPQLVVENVELLNRNITDRNNLETKRFHQYTDLYQLKTSSAEPTSQKLRSKIYQADSNLHFQSAMAKRNPRPAIFRRTLFGLL